MKSCHFWCQETVVEIYSGYFLHFEITNRKKDFNRGSGCFIRIPRYILGILAFCTVYCRLVKGKYFVQLFTSNSEFMISWVEVVAFSWDHFVHIFLVKWVFNCFFFTLKGTFKKFNSMSAIFTLLLMFQLRLVNSSF